MLSGWIGASVLVTPQQDRVSSLSHYLRICYMLGSGWMLHTQYLSVTDGDLFMQMKSILECWSSCLRRQSCSHPAYCGFKLENRTLKTATAPAVATGSPTPLSKSTHSFSSHLHL